LPDDHRSQLRRGAARDRLAATHRQSQGLHTCELAARRGRHHRRLRLQRRGERAVRRLGGAQGLHPDRPAAARARGGTERSEVYTMGTWKPNPGSQEAFVEAWSQFAGWASSMPGAGTLRLVRDLHEPGRFVSFGAWDSIDYVRAWKGSPEFKERMARVLQHV